MKVKLAQGRRQGFLPNGVPKLGMLDVPAASISWPKLAEKLSRHVETDDKGSVKYIVGGYFSDKRRIDDNLVARTLLTIDFDHVDEFDMLAVEDFDFACVAHTTWSHTEEDGRWRLIVPLSREIADKRVLEILTRHVASQISIEAMDPASCKMNQFMWMPSAKPGAPRGVITVNDQPLDVDAVLEQYDIDDPFSWPHPEGDQPDDRPQLDRLGDPREKPGLIGAFCRIYSITQAIAEFDLPYEPCEDDRWRFTPDTDANPGAKIYDDDTHMFSHHSGDPACGKNHNAWDLVRVHRFGELDVGVRDTPINEMPSQKAMQALAMKDRDVMDEHRAAQVEGFEDLSGSVDTPTEEVADAPVDRDTGALEYDALRARIDDRDAPFDMDAKRDYMTDLAAARLEPMEESELLGLLREASTDPKPTKKALEDTLKHIKQQARAGLGNAISDIEMDLVHRVLDRHYGKGRHLRRFADQFWRYEAGVWHQTSDEIVRGVITREIASLRTERPQDARALVAAIDDNTTSGQAGALWRMFCSLISVETGEEDPLGLMRRFVDPVINVRNGEIHFAEDGTYELRAHNPDHFLTTQIPVDFDPKADTSDWDDFCDLLFHDSIDPEDMKRHLEEVGGYCLQPWRELPTFFMIRGEPAAGKSTLGTLIAELMGDTVAAVDFSEYAGRQRSTHAEAGLVGKLLALDDDFTKGTALPDGFIKKVSEAKRVTVNPKNKPHYSVVLRAVPMMLTNHWPPTRDHSGALERRAIIFNLATIPEEERSEAARKRLLRAGLPGVLLAFVRGFARLYGRQAWALPLDCQDALTLWSRRSDSVRLWAHQWLEEAPGEKLTASTAWEAFNQWYHEEQPGGGYQLGRNKFYERADAVLGPRKRDSDNIQYVGWRLKDGTYEE